MSLSGASKEQRISARALYIPKDAKMVWSDEDGSAAYAYEWREAPCLMTFWGTAGKPTANNRYGTTEAREAALERFKASIADARQRKSARRQAKTAWTNPLKPGDVLYSSWGYDQTNIDFYVVTRVSGKAVWIAPVASDTTETGFMSGTCRVRRPIQITGPEQRHIAQPSGMDGGATITLTTFSSAWLDTRGEHGCSWYA